MSARAYRLPPHIRPLSYHIELTTDPSRSDFEGTVEIALSLQQASAQIDLHARNLTVSDAVVQPQGGDELVAQIHSQPERQIVTLSLPSPLPAGSATARLRFTGQLSPSMHGLYLGTDGVHRAICSQCEATDARAIFPCFDEPEFKAQLRWTLRTGPGVIALTNGTLDSAQPDGAGQVFRFAPTRPVSSYLAAVVVGDFESCPEATVSGIPLRVYAPRGKVGQTSFAQDFTKRLMPFYEEYFDYPYPFGKYDQVAVPGFDAGAMENIGLVLFRQNLLLMDPATASWRQEKLIAKVIAHEFAHMWFGNLVTMRWWDDLWLNEAFAEWMAHRATHAVAPSYEVWSDFIEDKGRVLFDDALRSTHPIWTPVQTPEEAIEMFDSITYQKGCAVMRQLENFLGQEAFRDGLRAYMKRFAYGNAQGADLWQALEQASGQPVSSLMHSWVAQSGYPLVDVTLEQEAGGPAHLVLAQQRFYSEPGVPPSEQLWSIPLVVRFADDNGVHLHRFICASRTHREALPATGQVRWCYANADEVGFYRQRHEATTMRRLIDAGLGQLSAVEQVGLLEDQWALVRSGSSPISRFLDVLRGYAGVRDHNVIRVLVERLDTLDLLVKDSGDRAARARLRALIAKLFTPHLDELGYVPREGEPQNDTQRRALVIGALAGLGRVPEVIREAERLAALEQRDPRSIDPNLAGVLVAVAAKFGDEPRYDLWVKTFVDRKQSGATPQEVARYLHTLSAFRRPALTSRTLELIDKGSIPQEAISSVLTQLLIGRHGQDATWTYLKDQWSGLRERVGDMGLSRVVEAVGRLRGLHREDIVRFFQKNPPAGAERALQRALERLDQSEQLRQRVTSELLSYLMAL
jgi:puromycin-sensitive aminopeptidase